MAVRHRQDQSAQQGETPADEPKYARTGYFVLHHGSE